MARYSTRLKKAMWHAVVTRDRIVVRKTRDPRTVKGSRYAFGPYRSRKEACEVGQYQRHGVRPEGCP